MATGPVRTGTSRAVDVLEFADGKLKAERSYFDTGSLMAQLGINAAQPASAE